MSAAKKYSFTHDYQLRTDEVNQSGLSFITTIGYYLQNTAHLHANPRAADKLLKLEAPAEPFSLVKEFDVRFRDIDINRHVNSIAFFEWITEALPPEILADYYCSEFEINYLKEALYGDTIVSSDGPQAGSASHDAVTYLHSLSRGGKEEIARARTRWQKTAAL